MNRIELTRSTLIKSLLANRWPQFLLTVLALGGFVLAIASGLVGTRVGNRNFGVIFTWIVWWGALILIALPFFGRGWCSICPIPAPGEWLQRGALLAPNGKGGLGLGRRWPRKLRNIWLQNAAFVLVALFSSVVLTQPRVTGIVLVGFLATALGTSLIFERRSFCRYLCPVGGFIGLYSQAAPLEVRVKDTAVCASHKEKTCYTGSEYGYGCPWNVFPGGLVKNTYCGTCMECLRTCTLDNIAVYARPFGKDLKVSRGRRLDEAFKAFIMLGSALIYAAVLLGPWGSLKSSAYQVGSLGWAAYTIALLGIVFLLLPGLFYLSVRFSQLLSGSNAPTKRAFINAAYVLVPLGLTAWIAFSLSFVFTNLSYVWPVLSDPFGWGWNLLGTVGWAWTPYLSQLVPVLQTIILLLGLVWAVASIKDLYPEKLVMKYSVLGSLPLVAYCLVASSLMLYLLVG
jgi:hypothetical protein